MLKFILLFIVVITISYFFKFIGNQFLYYIKKYVPNYAHFSTALEKWAVRKPKSWRVVKKFTLNLFIATSIILFLFLFRNYPPLIEIEDIGMDMLLQLHEEQIQPLQNNKVNAFTFIDIDRKTHEAWEYPTFTPRDKLKALIQVAAEKNPQFIVINIDISRHTPIDKKNGVNIHSSDAQLLKYLKNDFPKLCDNNKNCPKLIFVKNFKQPSEKKAELYGQVKQFLYTPRTIQRAYSSFLDNVIDNSPHMFWATTLYNISSDHVLRRWFLSVPICNVHNEPSLLPSVQLLVSKLSQTDKYETTYQELTQSTHQCTDNNYYVDNNISRYGNHILYTMPWKQPLYSDANNFLPRYRLPYQDGKSIALSVYPAQLLLTNENAINLNNQMVIIGSSNSEFQDMFHTPLGEMPGSLVIVNSTYSLLQYGQIKSVNSGYKLILTIITILIMSILFTFLHKTIWISLIAGSVVIGIFLFISMYFFSSGIYLDFLAPLIAIQYQQTISEIQALKDEIKRLQQ
ncbi:CHASE2 domain-containing protein [Candidatus Albibeggiatoa sp. nov. NOAA]|uniref:CHASE2 domain-containing protein n=1 Tax=Candidatus Albibeggiatoa sp. nov. NOAA TaxID=3162724 RepID=UPI0032FF2ED6|nr:CHASE2 domain-containing protein [Thiotrichaceae bacterium]